jgi:DNA-binding NarL/FixJ family response regulator
MMLAFMATGSDNQQMATLMNTSVESIRVRKSKLKKKMQENSVKIPEKMETEI